MVDPEQVLAPRLKSDRDSALTHRGWLLSLLRYRLLFGMTVAGACDRAEMKLVLGHRCAILIYERSTFAVPVRLTGNPEVTMQRAHL
jgi:hypothetical protein